MARITLTFDGTQADLDDYCEEHKYQETVTDENGEEVSNPETKAQFFDRTMHEHAWNSVKARRASRAADAARKAELDKEVNF